MAESQLRKGAVELITLGLLAVEPSYGGQLVERFRNEVGLEVSSGTLYPLLARLRKTGLVATSWQESPVGPPRKIYELAAKGRNRLQDLKAEWAVLNSAVEKSTRKDQER
ncbi:PadR family transcriptional regulator [Corynebacterium uterequi]|uniref:Transcriptional regulator, PadR family n=1 Tax=Corynebacterium uterequi TaxID=1072256 RepID=A0A0G3HCS0_9CORY|nr:PadR family transcriptional regulator [Corynebacterium uterequi]AKK11141.1 transcriptional regulator, PadR family [Corynebacterium uterequi]